MKHEYKIRFIARVFEPSAKDSRCRSFADWSPVQGIFVEMTEGIRTPRMIVIQKASTVVLQSLNYLELLHVSKRLGEFYQLDLKMTKPPLRFLGN